MSSDPQHSDGTPKDAKTLAAHPTRELGSPPDGSTPKEIGTANPDDKATSQPLTPEEQMARFEKDLKESDWDTNPVESVRESLA